MNRYLHFTLRLAVLSMASIAGTVPGIAQGWSTLCNDRVSPPPAPYSDDYAISGLMSDFVGYTIGLGGTANWGGCLSPTGSGVPLNADGGRFSFFNGPVGSIQTDFDNGLGLTVGAPRDPVGSWTFMEVVKDPGAGQAKTKSILGSGGFSYFEGSSRRYAIMGWSDGEVRVELELRLIGDAVRLRYRMFNTTASPLGIGLKWGATYGMISQGPDNQGFNLANVTFPVPGRNARTTADPVPYIGFTELPTTRPIRTMRNFLRANPSFPDFVNLQWSQNQPYGFRLDMTPNDSVPDATNAEGLMIGSHFYNMRNGDWNSQGMSGRIFNDPFYRRGDINSDPVYQDATQLAQQPVREDSDVFNGDPAVIVSYDTETVAPNQFRDIVVYVRSPWAVSEYLDPYSVVVDAPRLVEPDSTGTNGLSPNPMRIAAYIDNQYADVDREVTLTNVRMRINFPNGSGLRLADGETAEKTISTVGPNAVGRIEWNVEADGEAIGYQPYTVTFAPTPGPVKTVRGQVLVSATPRVRISDGANLVTIPWEFSDTSLDAIFGPIGDPNALKLGRDYVAYRWNPDLGEYQPVTSATRGSSLWIVPVNDLGLRALNGAQVPRDEANGGVVTTLQPGWNMIGNPYSIPVPLSQLIGVGDDDPSRTLTWRELVNNGWVSGSLAFWKRSADDPESGSYLFTAGDSDLIQPQTGYWVFVSTLRPIRLSWPPVFAAGLSTTTRSANAVAETWRQTDKQWRLQLVARSNDGQDTSNYIGVAANAAEANRRRIYEPPAAPDSKLDLSIRDQINGKPTRMAQVLADKMGKRTFTLTARSKTAGDVTVTWPNLNTVPRNVRVTIEDPATNTTRDLRFASAYSFRMDQPGSRELKVTIEPAGAQRAVIGNVSVSRPSRSPGAALSITYTLSTDATTSVRILSGAGKEVFTISRGRSVSAGQRTDTWNLRDRANRAVAPGTYQVEILAETANGERVRRVVPVNITR